MVIHLAAAVSWYSKSSQNGHMMANCTFVSTISRGLLGIVLKEPVKLCCQEAQERARALRTLLTPPLLHKIQEGLFCKARRTVLSVMMAVAVQPVIFGFTKCGVDDHSKREAANQHQGYNLQLLLPPMLLLLSPLLSNRLSTAAAATILPLDCCCDFLSKCHQHPRFHSTTQAKLHNEEACYTTCTADRMHGMLCIATFCILLFSKI